jgi:hypothetical protein
VVAAQTFYVSTSNTFNISAAVQVPSNGVSIAYDLSMKSCFVGTCEQSTPSQCTSSGAGVFACPSVDSGNAYSGDNITYSIFGVTPNRAEPVTLGAALTGSGASYGTPSYYWATCTAGGASCTAISTITAGQPPSLAIGNLLRLLDRHDGFWTSKQSCITDHNGNAERCVESEAGESSLALPRFFEVPRLLGRT